jgi:hypothetical protein
MMKIVSFIRYFSIPIAVLCAAIFIACKDNHQLAGANPDQIEKIQLFPLENVRLLDGPFKTAMQRNRQRLLGIETDRLLHNFYINAGLPSDAVPLGGWEQREVRGHTMGHYLSACALIYASTHDIVFKERAAYLVQELARCQDTLGSSGYLSAFPESFIDRVENMERVWAPYYVLHKILAGLVDVYEQCENEQSLDVAVKMADWLKSRCAKYDDERMQGILEHTEQGGLLDALAKLSALTGNSAYLDMAERFVQHSYLDPLVRHEDKLTGLHGNSLIPNGAGFVRLFKLTGDRSYYHAAQFFWKQVAKHRSFSTGGTTVHEHWRTPPDTLKGELDHTAQESCCTYNMLKLTHRLFCFDPDPDYMDYYERGLYNHILATQNPDDGTNIYFLSLKPGHWKIYDIHDNAFWCCTGTGFENHSKYGRCIYAHGDNAVYVNLYIASELDWQDKDLSITMNTAFPEEDRIKMSIRTTKPRAFPIYLRIPWWASKGVQLEVNHDRIHSDMQPSSYVKLDRTWQDGDQISLKLPMTFQLDYLPGDPNHAAILYGPIVLAGALGREGLTTGMQYSSNNQLRVDPDAYPGCWAPSLVGVTDSFDWIRKTSEEEPLTFETIGVGRPMDVKLMPFYNIHDQRYNIYWKLED